MIGPLRRWRVMQPRERKSSYDVVIVGGGVHGLSIAYELAKRGVRDVAVLEKAYIGAGGSGRNTAIIRSNYRTPEGVAFYAESVRIYEGLSVELGFNLLFSQHGHLTLAHTDSAVAGLRVRAEVNQLQGVDSVVIGLDEIRELAPALDLSDHPRYPIQAALYHPPGGIIRHDAVVWGYARRASQMGVDIHQGIEVTGIDLADGRIAGVRTGHGSIRAGTVVNATAGWASTIAEMAGVRLPIVTHPLQALVCHGAQGRPPPCRHVDGATGAPRAADRRDSRCLGGARWPVPRAYRRAGAGRELYRRSPRRIRRARPAAAPLGVGSIPRSPKRTGRGRSWTRSNGSQQRFEYSRWWADRDAAPCGRP